MVLVGTLSFNFQVLMPLLAHSTWHGTATTYAVMTMAMGVGSVGGALLTGGRGRVSSRLIVGAAAAVRRLRAARRRRRPRCRCRSSRSSRSAPSP